MSSGQRTPILAFNEDNVSAMPNGAGNFILFNRSKQVIYVGTATGFNLQDKMREHLEAGNMLDAKFFQAIMHTTGADARNESMRLISEFKPKYN